MNNETIQQICEEMSETSNTRSEIIKEVLTALEPFIPKWVKVEDIDTDTGKEYLGKNEKWIHPDFNPHGIRICVVDPLGCVSAEWDNNQDCYDSISEEEYPTHVLEIPVSHPYELLLTNLKIRNNEHSSKM